MNTSPQQTLSGGINSFMLKLIAILGMTLDHLVIVFNIQQPLWAKIMLFAFGGLTFPIMAFLLVEGYKHTSNFKRYALRLLLFAFITYIPYMWAMRGFGLNVLFTLLLGLITLYLYDHMKNRVRRHDVGYHACKGVAEHHNDVLPVLRQFQRQLNRRRGLSAAGAAHDG